MELIKQKKLNKKYIFMMISTVIILLWLMIVIGLLARIEYMILFSYAFSKDWFVYPVLALYLIAMGITLLFSEIKTLFKLLIGLFIGFVSIGLSFILLLGFTFGFANTIYEVPDTNMIIIRTDGIMDYYYDLYDVKSGVFAKSVADLNSHMYPFSIDKIESEFTENTLIIKVINHKSTFEVYLYMDVVNDSYILTDEVRILK